MKNYFSIHVRFLWIAAFMIATASPVCLAVNYSKGLQWRDVFPDLERAALLPPKDGVALLIQQLGDVRAGVAIQLMQHCSSSTPRPICDGDLGNPVLENRIDAELDEEFKDRVRSYGSMTSFDYVFQTVGPFTVITALRSNRGSYAAIYFELVEASIVSRARFEALFGQPSEESIDEKRNSVLVYRTSANGFNRVLKLILRGSGPTVVQVMMSAERK